MTLSGLILASPLLLANVHVGGDGNELRAVLAEWRARQAVSRRVKYVCEGTATIPRGRWNGDPDLIAPRGNDVPTGDHQHRIAFSLWLDYERNLMRVEVQDEIMHLNEACYFPRRLTRVYNSDLRSHAPREGNYPEDRTPSEWHPEFVFDPDRNTETVFQLWQHPLLFAHGIFCGANATIDAARLRTPFDEAQFELRGRAVHDGVTCLLVRHYPYPDRRKYHDDFWVDLARGAAIVRWDARQNLVNATSTIQYGRKQDGWYPVSWRVDQYHDAGARPPVLTESYAARVTEFALNPPMDSALFALEPEPGMVVLVKDDANVFRLADDGKTLIQLNGRRGPPRAYWGWYVAGGCLLIGIITWWRLRSRRRLRFA